MARTKRRKSAPVVAVKSTRGRLFDDFLPYLITRLAYQLNADLVEKLQREDINVTRWRILAVLLAFSFMSWFNRVSIAVAYDERIRKERDIQPDLIGYVYDFRPESVLAMLQRALKKFEPVDAPAIDFKTKDKRFVMPEKGLVVASTTRVSPAARLS